MDVRDETKGCKCLILTRSTRLLEGGTLTFIELHKPQISAVSVAPSFDFSVLIYQLQTISATTNSH